MKKTFILFILLLGTLYSSSAQSVDVYISANGKDSNLGTKQKPLKTLEKAIGLLAQKYQQESFDEANIFFAPGLYPNNKTVKIDAGIFGGNDVKLIIGRYGKGDVLLSGGTKIQNSLFKKVNGVQTERLHEKAKDKVLVANLSGTNAENAFRYLDVDKEWQPMAEQFSYLAWNEHLLQLARWPNRGYAHIDKIMDGGPTNRWLKPGEKPKPFSLDNPTGGVFTTIEQSNWLKWDTEFQPNGQMLVEGYLHNDWYFQRERIGDLKNGVIKLLHHSRYGIFHKKGMIERRVRFVNLLCELDQPGEWYFDADTKELFIWPIAKLDKNVVLSVIGGEKFIQLDSLKNVTIRNLVFQNGGKPAVEINGGENNTIGGCIFRNFIGRGFAIKGGKNNGVTSCTFYGLMGAGSISGGNRKTLEACNNYFINNEIFNCRNRGYGAIGISGVGLRFANNLLHDMNGALAYSGNDIVIEYNEFYNMGWEMGDWNVAYIGADWASFGNKVRFNFVHHLMEMPGAYPVEGFRNDDLGMGTAFDGNVFYKAGRGAIAFSGSGNSAQNNIVLETPKLWSAFFPTKNMEDVKEKWNHKLRYDSGELKRGDKEDNLWRAEQYYGKMGWLFEPYKSKYPKLKTIMNHGNPFAPTYSVVKNNFTDGDISHSIYIHKSDVSVLPPETEWEYPKTISKDVFVDPSVLNFDLKEGVNLGVGFQPIPFSRIGLYKDEFRTNIPDKNTYRKAIKERYNGVPSQGGSYNIKEVYKRYPVPEYLNGTNKNEKY